MINEFEKEEEEEEEENDKRTLIYEPNKWRGGERERESISDAPAVSLLTQLNAKCSSCSATS